MIESTPEGRPSSEVPPRCDCDSERIVYQSEALFRDGREIWIEHGEHLYRLRATSSGKLYLTK